MRDTRPDRLAIDGATELLRCPDLRRGWSATDAAVSYVGHVWRLPRDCAAARDKWERDHAGERSDPKVAIQEVSIGRDGQLTCLLRPTEWAEVRPVHERYVEPAWPTRDETGNYRFHLPNICVVHVVAWTADDQILLAQRSETLHYHPGRWSATYEEGLSPEDVGSGSPFHAAVVRGFREEFQLSNWDHRESDVSLLAVVLEAPLENPAIVASLSLPLSLDELLDRGMGSTELQAGSVRGLRMGFTQGGELEQPNSADLPDRGDWHPTARYRLVVSVEQRFGTEQARRLLHSLRH